MHKLRNSLLYLSTVCENSTGPGNSMNDHAMNLIMSYASEGFDFTFEETKVK